MRVGARGAGRTPHRPRRASLLQEKALDWFAVFNLGMGEITVILLLALIFVGPKKLPELAAGLGKLIREFRKTTSDIKNEITLDDAIRKPFEELRDAVTLHPEELKRRDRIRRDLEAAQRQVAELAAKAEAAPAEGDTAATAAGEDDAAASSMTAEGAPPPQLPEASANGMPAPPLFPTGAPAGTIARDVSGPLPSSLQRRMTPSVPVPALGKTQPDLSRTLQRMSDTHRETARMAVVPPAPIEDGAADKSNTTQALSDRDLAAILVRPPPPPATPRTGRTMPPPRPGPPPPPSAKSAPAPDEKKSEPPA